MKTKYLKPAVLVSLASTLLVACSDRKQAAAIVPPTMPSPIVAVAAQPAVMAMAQPVAPTPPPMPGAVAVVPAPAAVAPAAEASGTVAPMFRGNTEAERLTWALRAYYDDSSRPAISSFEPMVAQKLIKAVPVPPPGKKYVIDLKEAQVRLENN